jgi:DNA-binding transcriptional MerR regulator
MSVQGDSEQAVHKLWYRIGEVARLAEVDPSVLRHWESEFRALRPKRSRSGQRLYSRTDLQKVLQIKQLLYNERYTIKGAVQQLRASGQEPRISADPVVRSNDALRNALREIRSDIIELIAALDKESESCPSQGSPPRPVPVLYCSLRQHRARRMRARAGEPPTPPRPTSPSHRRPPCQANP